LYLFLSKFQILSHYKERKEKNCLNCEAEVQGRFCQVCGQENLEPRETVWHFITHFFYDITHFDGKFFSTVRYLLLKPGFLSKQYIAGKRVSYLHPIRMYVFTSAFFFIIFFSLFKAEKFMESSDEDKEKDLKELVVARASLDTSLALTTDTIFKAAMYRTMHKLDNNINKLSKEIEGDKIKDSVELIKDSASLVAAKQKLDTLEKEIPFVKGASKGVQTAIDHKKKRDSSSYQRNNVGFWTELNISSRMAYDSVQKELPPERRDGWLKKVFVHNSYDMEEKMKRDKKEAFTVMVEKFLHTLPQVLFLTLPTFALILMILYARRKQFYYVDHGVFSIHVFCASFLLLLVFFGFSKLKDTTGYNWIGIFKTIVSIGIFFYLYKAMRNFYGQRRAKTILKFSILVFWSFICIVLLTAILFVYSVVKFS
jgi:Protein of unknown function (DUF3667)